MLALLRSNRRRHLIGELHSSNCLNRFPFQYYFSSASSVAAAAFSSTFKNGSSDFMVDYLEKTIGLSRDEALSASTKVSHLKSTEKPDLFINLLQNYGGLDQSHVRKLVSSVPQVLLHKPDETLESKLRVFQDLGLTGSHLVKLIKTSPDVLTRGLDTTIVAVISYLRQLMGGCDDKVVKAINRSSWLLSSSNTLKLMPSNIVLLQQKYGFSDEQIEKLIISYPRVLLRKPERLHDVFSRVEGDFGIPRNSPRFFYGFLLFHSMNRGTMEKKFSVFRSFGWSDSDIVVMVSTLPLTMTISESSMQQRLNFYMKELGFTPAYLVTWPHFFTYSLEKRVRPRNEVLKILKELKLVKSSMHLSSVLRLTEVKFVERFLLPYKDKVPNMYETYTEKTRNKVLLTDCSTVH